MWCWAVVLVSLCGSRLLRPAGIKMNKRREAFSMRLQRKQSKTHTQTHTEKGMLGKKTMGLKHLPFSGPKGSWHMSLTPAAVREQDKGFPHS